MKSVVVAHDQNGVIGYEGGIPWNGRLPRDMKRFKDLTSGHAVVMGRLTFESIGEPLKNRQNIVISRSSYQIDGVQVVSSLDEAYQVAQGSEHTFVIGGHKIYQLAMPTVDRLHITIVEAEFPGDTFFVEVDENEWVISEEKLYSRDEQNEFDCRFITYERRVTDAQAD